MRSSQTSSSSRRPRFDSLQQHVEDLEYDSDRRDDSEYQWAAEAGHRPSPNYQDRFKSRYGAPSRGVSIDMPERTSGKRRTHEEDMRLDPAGLTILYEPDGDPIADLVFVHGIGGGSLRSWSADEPSNTFWPGEWLPHEEALGAVRIHTYGYSSRVSAADPDRVLELSDIAKDLLAKLKFGQGRQGRSLNVGCAPIIFISHSLGGLIAKKAYILATSDPSSVYGAIAEATAGFVFFSTPHRELHKGLYISDILAACIQGWRASYHAELVRTYLPRLQEINEKFRDLAQALEIFSFYERSMARYPASEELMLPQQVVTLDHPNETGLALEGDHVSITRFASRSDSNFSTVRGALQHLVSKFRSRRRAVQAENASGQLEEVDQLLQRCEAPHDDLTFFSDKRIDGSCEWILESALMDPFLEDEQASTQIMWCYGGPGSGKSVTTTFLIEQLQEASKCCAYYYFRSGNQDKNSLNRFLTSTARQLSQQLPEYRRKLFSLAQDRFDVDKASHKLLWKKLFTSLLFQCSPTKPIFLVLDGLDELAHAKELLQKMLIDAAEASIALRILLVSRPTIDIETSIEKLSKKIKVQRLALDCNAEDLDLYVRDEMETMPGDDDFKEHTVSAVLRKADGNFLWAHLVVQEILGCQTEDQVEDALRQVPRELEPLYERMDNRLADALRSRPQDQRLGRQIIMWAACSRRPLHLDELALALRQDFPRIMDVRQTTQRLCGEFVQVDKQSYISMMHASAREFLISRADRHYHVNSKATNHALFSRCVQYLSTNLKDYDKLPEKERDFLDYAASSWPFHLSNSLEYQDLESLSILTMFFESRHILDWIFMLARTSKLRIMVEASKSVAKLLKAIDRADRERNPLTHRLKEKETISAWTQDLIRVVGKFGPQLVQHPRTAFNLLPAFCPRETMLHRQFAHKKAGSASREEPLISVLGNTNPTWDDCFAKFAVPGDNLPRAIVSLDRYFAILTKTDGVIHLYYSATCELARRLEHRELVINFCVNPGITRVATYSLRKTMVWDIESGQHLFSIENPKQAKAMAMAFQQDSDGEDMLLTFSDDRRVRACALSAMRIQWAERGGALKDDAAQAQVNAPNAALFSPDGQQLAISYRGANPAVWDISEEDPELVAYCDHRTRNFSSQVPQSSRQASMYVSHFAWNPLTGHLVGVYNDGLVFKWHPQDDDYESSNHRGGVIKCSVDGKLFITGSGDGTLKIWDFEHLTPIYQLKYPNPVQDLDLGRNDARIYDLRGQYCNIWEPSSLLRAMETDEISSDTHSSKDSELRTQMSEATQQDFEPITAIASQEKPGLYAVGDESGKILICDIKGQIVLELQDQPTGFENSVEQLLWSQSGTLLVSLDLGREIRVRNIGQSSHDVQEIISFEEHDQVLQVVVEPSDDRLMVVTPTAAKVYQLPQADSPAVIPLVRTSRWLSHPCNEKLILGFSVDRVTIAPWSNITQTRTLLYGPQAPARSSSGIGTLRLPNPRRPSQAYPASPSEIQQVVNKVMASPDNALIMVEIYGSTKQTRRRVDCLLVQPKMLSIDEASGSPDAIPVHSIPNALFDVLFISLGFVEIDAVIPTGRNGHGFEHRRSISRKQADCSTFVFIDKDFWICSVSIGAANPQAVDIRKHFFLPRDWQNVEWLEMATVTPSGQFLCPKNGDVAVVTNGFLAEMTV